MADLFLLCIMVICILQVDHLEKQVGKMDVSIKFLLPCVIGSAQVHSITDPHVHSKTCE